MESEKLTEKYQALLLEAQRQVESFVNFLADQNRNKKRKSSKTRDFKSFKFVGIWAGREEMSDSSV